MSKCLKPGTKIKYWGDFKKKKSESLKTGYFQAFGIGFEELRDDTVGHYTEAIILTEDGILKSLCFHLITVDMEALDD